MLRITVDDKPATPKIFKQYKAAKAKLEELKAKYPKANIKLILH